MFSEELRKIILSNSVHIIGTHEDSRTLYPDNLIPAITELVKKKVPGERKRGYNPYLKYNQGFNSCRAEMLKRIE